MKKFRHIPTGRIAVPYGTQFYHIVGEIGQFPEWSLIEGKDWEEIFEYPIGTKIKNTLNNRIYEKVGIDPQWRSSDGESNYNINESFEIGKGRRFEVVPPVNNNPLELEIGKTYTLKYTPCPTMEAKEYKITRFTDDGYPWGEQINGCENGIITDHYRIIKSNKPSYTILSFKNIDKTSQNYNRIITLGNKDRFDVPWEMYRPLTEEVLNTKHWSIHSLRRESE